MIFDNQDTHVLDVNSFCCYINENSSRKEKLCDIFWKSILVTTGLERFSVPLMRRSVKMCTEKIYGEKLSFVFFLFPIYFSEENFHGLYQYTSRQCVGTVELASVLGYKIVAFL